MLVTRGQVAASALEFSGTKLQFIGETLCGMINFPALSIWMAPLFTRSVLRTL